MEKEFVINPLCFKCANFPECWRKNSLVWVLPGFISTSCPGHSDNNEPKKD